MSDTSGGSGPGGGGAPNGRVRPIVALAFATILFAALVIWGIGMLSLLTGQDVISDPDYGEFPGIAAVFAATIAFAATLWLVLRRPRPGFAGGVWAAAVCFLVYLVVIWIGGAAHTQDIVLATAVVGRVVTHGFALVVAGAALVCAWGAVVLVHRRGGRPRWPWERDDTP